MGSGNTLQQEKGPWSLGKYTRKEYLSRRAWGGGGEGEQEPFYRFLNLPQASSPHHTHCIFPYKHLGRNIKCLQTSQRGVCCRAACVEARTGAAEMERACCKKTIQELWAARWGEGQRAFPKPRQEPWESGEDFLVIKVSDGDHSFVTAENRSPSSLPTNPQPRPPGPFRRGFYS